MARNNEALGESSQGFVVMLPDQAVAFQVDWEVSVAI